MTTTEAKDGTQIYFKDWGKGQPIVFHHGWPLTADDWDAQMLFFLHHGYRVIAHDRRGHGRSSQTCVGNDMDTYAEDVAQLATPSTSGTPSTSATQPAAARLPVM
jgi:non-heme chloroperoxidase